MFSDKFWSYAWLKRTCVDFFVLFLGHFDSFEQKLNETFLRKFYDEMCFHYYNSALRHIETIYKIHIRHYKQKGNYTFFEMKKSTQKI